MKTVTPETRLSYWQKQEQPENALPKLRAWSKTCEYQLLREAKRAEAERQLREIIWYIGATFSAVVFCGLCVAFIVLIWAAMQ